MVKPTILYLDILSEARRELCPDLPLACYQVSGEFAMIHAGARAGVYELKRMAVETAESMVRAGATIILSYFTPEFLDVSKSQQQWTWCTYLSIVLTRFSPQSGSMNHLPTSENKHCTKDKNGIRTLNTVLINKLSPTLLPFEPPPMLW
jgi:hypothetical protein